MIDVAATEVDILVLFSCPETYGPSWIVGHYVAANMKAQLTGEVFATPAVTYG
jgi:hypothetical protein